MEWAVCAEKAGKNAVLSLKKVCLELICLGKMEIIEEKCLEKWKYYVSLPWKNVASFSVEYVGFIYNGLNLLKIVTFSPL